MIAMSDLLNNREVNKTTYRRRQRATGKFETRGEWEIEVKRLIAAGTHTKEIAKLVGSTRTTIFDFGSDLKNGY